MKGAAVAKEKAAIPDTTTMYDGILASLAK